MELIVFDLDGVRAGVSESYREATVRTVEHFTGKRISRDLIQQYKNCGGWNRLMDRCGLAIFTDRVRREAGITLRRFVPGVRFSPIICPDDVTTEKPAPDGILALQRLHRGRGLVSVGDTVDDARSASAAGVPFTGIAGQSHSHRSDLIRLFEQERAIAILENVNEIEAVL